MFSKVIAKEQQAAFEREEVLFTLFVIQLVK